MRLHNGIQVKPCGPENRDQSGTVGFDKNKPYWSQKQGFPPKDINRKASFKEGKEPTCLYDDEDGIVCRHVSTYFSKQVLLNQGGKFDLSQLDSIENIEKNISPSIEYDHYKLIKNPQEVHFIGHKCLGNFFATQFREMWSEGQSVKSYIIRCDEFHTMALRLRIKINSQSNEKLNVVSFYDPSIIESEGEGSIIEYVDRTIRCEVDDITRFESFSGDYTFRSFITYDAPENWGDTLVIVNLTDLTRSNSLEMHQKSHVIGDLFTPKMMNMLMFGGGNQATFGHYECTLLKMKNHPGYDYFINNEFSNFLEANIDDDPGIRRAIKYGQCAAIRGWASLSKYIPDELRDSLIIRCLSIDQEDSTMLSMNIVQFNRVDSFIALFDVMKCISESKRKCCIDTVMNQLLASIIEKGDPMFLQAVKKWFPHLTRDEFEKYIYNFCCAQGSNKNPTLIDLAIIRAIDNKDDGFRRAWNKFWPEMKL